MGLLGEISKSSEALRYHARTAEVAGQNLAHVNDENYARQRVLAREGVMHTSFGGLLSSGLETGGVDHARNQILDARVINEKGDSASLAAQQEILQLLQGALGEKINRQGVNVGLDDLHESDLAPGSLTRALNDFFNTFQELSASPYEPTIKQELFHKIETLTKRFNEAGHSLEQIESDVSEVISRSTDQINILLGQIHETNTQVRRFELLDQGKAVSYRDQRQKLFEELGSLINFSQEDDVSAATGKVSGFVNLFIDGENGEKINILDSKGAKNLTNQWGQEFTITAPTDPTGTAAVVRAKIDSSGQLGRLEVLKGGSKYDDSDGPFLVSILPPKPDEPLLVVDPQGNEVPAENQAELALQQVEPVQMANQAVDAGNEIAAQTGGDIASTTPVDPSSASRKIGEVFYEGNSYYQALVDTQKGDLLTDETRFLAISDSPNGIVSETKRTFSDVDFFSKGTQIYYEGKVYQATTDVGPVLNEVGLVDPATESVISSRNYSNGEVFQFNNNYYQATKNVSKGTEISSLPTTAGSVDKSGIVALGATLPQKSQELDVSWPNGNALIAGSVISFVDPSSPSGSGGNFYMAVADVAAATTELPSSSSNFIKIGAFVDDTISTVQSLPENVTSIKDGVQVTELQINFDAGKIYYDETSATHFLVKAKPNPISGDAEINTFNPLDAKWKNNFHVFTPDATSGLPPTSVLRKSNPGGLNITNGSLQELNIGVAEAIIQNGEIKSFHILQKSNDLPSTDAIFVNGVEVDLKSGSLHGYQHARQVELEDFRVSLNDLVSKFVTQVNSIYNPQDAPGEYLFGFEANLTRPTMGRNVIMEEEFGLYGVEGNGEMKLFRNEVNMTLAYAEDDTFTVTSTTPVIPVELKAQFEGTGYIIRDTVDGQLQLEDTNSGSLYTFYGSAKRMQNVTMETDSSYAGEDLLIGTADDGRSVMLAYENVPFRLEQGDSEFLLGDNFSFDAVLDNNWNLASSLIVDNNLSAESIVASLDFDQGSNDLALAIAELGNNEFAKDISDINADIGNSLSDLSDNIDHQNTIETLLLDQRNAISSVSIDEEVADLMQFQRSFQASSRVLNTLDKMLELVVMGLLK